MIEFFFTLANGIALLPPYLTILSIILVVIPTFLALILRFSLYQHLQYLLRRLKTLIRGERPNQIPPMINYLEQRLQQNPELLEQSNTPALVEASYSQEKFRFLGIPLSCEGIDYLTRNLPNLLLAFGLFGTFLGITINLASLSQTLTQSNLGSTNDLIQQLEKPLQGMGIAFITSLIAVFCSSILTLCNAFWNTNLAKSSLLSYLEDYLDNIYSFRIPRLPKPNYQQSVEKLVNEFSLFLTVFSEKFEVTLEKVMRDHVARPLNGMIKENQTNINLAKEVYGELKQSSLTFGQGTTHFEQAVSSLEKSRFSEKISEAISELAIAQNQFAQSALILNKSTKSFENTLELTQRSIMRIIQLTEEMTALNEKYNIIFSHNQAKSYLDSHDQT